MIQALFLVFIWTASQPGEIEAITAALRAHDFRNALALSIAASKAAPRDPRLWVLTALADEGLGRADEALEAYARALSIDTRYLPALKGKAGLEYKTGNARAAGTLSRIVEQQPGDEMSHAMLGALAFKAGNCNEVLHHYRLSSNVIQSEPAALTEEAECLLKHDQTAEAIGVLKQVVPLKPDGWTAKYNLAIAQLRTNNAAAALAALEPLLTAAKPQHEVLALASSVYESQGDTPHAVEALRRAIVQNPAGEDLYLDFVNLSFAHKAFQVGIDMVTAGLTQLPNSARLYVARGALSVQLGKYDNAEADFATAEKLDPNQSFSSIAEGVTQLQQTNFGRALSATEAQIKRTPNDAFLYYLKAETLKSKGIQVGTREMRDAIESAAEAVRLRPGFSLARNLLGSLYLQQGRQDLARKQFESVVRLESNNEPALYHLIQLERGAGHEDRVHALLKQLSDAKARAQTEAVKASKYQLVESGTPMNGVKGR